MGSLWFACCQEEFITSSYPTSLLRLGCTLCVWPSLGDHWGHFALFVRTYWPDHFCPNENFTFNQNYNSVRLILNSMLEGNGFLAKTLGKSLFHCQNDQSGHGPASQFWLWESALSAEVIITQLLLHSHFIGNCLSCLLKKLMSDHKM